MLTRSDVERIVENVLRQLTIEVKADDMGSNIRTIELWLGDRKLTEKMFSIEQTKE